MVSLKIALLILGALCLMLVAWAQLSEPTANSTARVPILVELFTSEGCSSCPPADAFLRKLDQQPLPGAEMIVLSEHVDYWNHDGWKDPYSSAFFTDRQSAYARRLSSDRVYTPQMIVDGTSEFVGSNQTEAEKAFNKALSAEKVALRLSAVSVDAWGALRARVEVPALPASGSAQADVWFAVALDHAESQVSAGENSGRHLTHTGVVKTLIKVGAVRRDQAFTHDVQVKLYPSVGAGNLRLVAFVQEPHQGRILGAALQPVSAKSAGVQDMSGFGPGEEVDSK